jgi:hypothetical protein
MVDAAVVRAAVPGRAGELPAPPEQPMATCSMHIVVVATTRPAVAKAEAPACSGADENLQCEAQVTASGEAHASVVTVKCGRRSLWRS